MTIVAAVESAAQLFEGRLSDSVQRLWLRYYPVSRHARFKELLLQNIRPTDRPCVGDRGWVREMQSESLRPAWEGSSLRGRRPR